MLSAARTGAIGLLLLGSLTACDDGTPVAAPDIRPVRVMTVEGRAAGEVISLTGTIQAETDVNLAFRIDGRMVERSVNVGDRVTAGQVVARLNRDNEESGLRSARATLQAANARVVETRNNYSRQRQLLASGFTTRVRYDEATQQLQAATSAADSARAQVQIAENRLGYTDLVADSNGTVTARGAEPGEVVQPGRMILVIAQEGGRDAVFGVPASVKDRAPENPVIDVSLTTDPAIRAVGRVREVAPRADAVTGTFQVRVGLAEPPPGLRLGSTVTGRLRIGGGEGFEIPASALTRIQGNPAVWIVDAAAQTVSLRPVEVARFDPAGIVVSSGLMAGDIVVTAGVQALRPGQKVRLLGAAS